MQAETNSLQELEKKQSELLKKLSEIRNQITKLNTDCSLDEIQGAPYIRVNHSYYRVDRIERDENRFPLLYFSESVHLVNEIEMDDNGSKSWYSTMAYSISSDDENLECIPLMDTASVVIEAIDQNTYDTIKALVKRSIDKMPTIHIIDHTKQKRESINEDTKILHTVDQGV